MNDKTSKGGKGKGSNKSSKSGAGLPEALTHDSGTARSNDEMVDCLTEVVAGTVEASEYGFETLEAAETALASLDGGVQALARGQAMRKQIADDKKAAESKPKSDVKADETKADEKGAEVIIGKRGKPLATKVLTDGTVVAKYSYQARIRELGPIKGLASKIKNLLVSCQEYAEEVAGWNAATDDADTVRPMIANAHTAGTLASVQLKAFVDSLDAMPADYKPRHKRGTGGGTDETELAIGAQVTVREKFQSLYADIFSVKNTLTVKKVAGTKYVLTTGDTDCPVVTLSRREIMPLPAAA